MALGELLSKSARSYPLSLTLSPKRASGQDDSEVSFLSPRPLGGGGALHREPANDLCVELITNQLHTAKTLRTPGVVVFLHDQFQTYIQSILTFNGAPTVQPGMNVPMNSHQARYPLRSHPGPQPAG